MHLRCRLAILLLLMVLLPGCSSLVQAPTVVLKEARLAGLDTSGLDLEFHLGVSNPNTFDLSLLAYTFALQVTTLPLSSGGRQEKVLFPAGKETDMRLPVRLQFADLLEILRRTPDPDNIPYQLNSILTIDTPLGEMTVPLEKQAILAVPEPYRKATIIRRLRDALPGHL